MINLIMQKIRFKTSILQSDLCDVCIAYTYIVVKGTINVTDPNNDEYDKKLAFKNNGQLISCITLFNNAEGLDIVMPMYNLIEYSKNC